MQERHLEEKSQLNLINKIAIGACVFFAASAASIYIVAARRMRKSTAEIAQGKAELTAAVQRGARQAQRDAAKATRKISLAVVNTVCDDLDRVVVQTDPETSNVATILEGVAMTQLNLSKQAPAPLAKK